MSSTFRMASLVIATLVAAPVAAHADDWSEAELKRLEGQFELTYKNAAGTTFKIVRDVLGDVEVVTHYDDAGHVVNSHRASIKVEKRGAVCVFSFFNAVVTAGPNKGATQLETNSYVYRFANDTFVEAWGLLENDPNPPRMHVWRRVKSPYVALDPQLDPRRPADENCCGSTAGLGVLGSNELWDAAYFVFICWQLES